MQKLISILTVSFLLIAAVFITSACKGGNHGEKHAMCCKEDCCATCDGKECCEGKECKATCEKMCADSKCCTADKCDKDCCEKCKSGTCCKGEKCVAKKDCCEKGDKAGTAAYVCPMHPNITSDKPGKCSECGMDLEQKK